MGTRKVRKITVMSVATVTALALASCGGGGGGGGETEAPSTPTTSSSSASAAPARNSMAIQPLFVQGDSGGVGEEEVSRQEVSDGSFRIDFSEDEVSGMGDASRAASWNAAIVSTLLTGQPLSGRFGFQISGMIDGPSAGALKTLGLIALSRGDTIDSNTTMTGTINSTGTIGPVGGIPEKINGASESGITKVLIPFGQRNTPNSQGEMVDVVRAGDRLGVEVIEVGDIYEAYPHLTGQNLPQPSRASDPRLDPLAYDKIEAQVTATFGRFESAENSFHSTSDIMVQSLADTGIVDEAVNAYTEAKDLQRQGLIAGAFNKAQEAAAYMEMLDAAATLMDPLVTQGYDALGKVINRALSTQASNSKFMGFLDSLGTFTPKTISDVEALVHAYAGAFDALTLLDFASNEISSIQTKFENNEFTSEEELLTQFTIAVLYQKLAEGLVTNAQSLYEVGRDIPGASLTEDYDLHEISDFFRRGADANLAAFRSSGVVKSLADSNGLSTDVVINALSNYDINVGIAMHQQAVLPIVEDYIGTNKPNSSYAAMGYGVNNYVRNQMLVEKYYNNAVLDENFQLVGLNFEGALNNAIDLSRDQLASEVVVLRGHEVDPVITVGAYEAAGISPRATPDDKYNVFSQYSLGFITARLLSYLGGWQQDQR